MIQQFTFDGSGRQIDARGIFFRYESATDGSGFTDLMVMIDGQNMGVFSPGDSLELPTSARRWEIKPVSSGCTGVVKIGNALIKSQKLQGIVQTIDGGRSRSLAGAAFCGYAWRMPVAGSTSRIQLWNPAGSGRYLVINALTAANGSTPNGLHVQFMTTALSGFVQIPQSKRSLSSASSVAEIRNQATGVLDESKTIKAWSAQVNATYEYRPTEPIIVVPGSGVGIVSAVINADCGASFEWFEEPI